MLEFPKSFNARISFEGSMPFYKFKTKKKF